jgi:hypothetical protein
LSASELNETFLRVGEILGIELPESASFDECLDTGEYPSYLTQVAKRAMKGRSAIKPEHIVPASLPLLRTCSMESLAPVLDVLLTNAQTETAPTPHMDSMVPLFDVALERVRQDEEQLGQFAANLVTVGAKHNLLNVGTMSELLFVILARVRSGAQSSRERLEFSDAMKQIEALTLRSADELRESSSSASASSPAAARDLYWLVRTATLILAVDAHCRVPESRARVELMLEMLLQGGRDSLFVQHAGKKEWEILCVSLGPALAQDALMYLEAASAGHFECTKEEGVLLKVSHDFVIRKVTGAFLRLGLALSQFSRNDFLRSEGLSTMNLSLAETLGNRANTPLEQLKENVEHARDDLCAAWLPQLERIVQTPGYSTGDAYAMSCKVYLVAERYTLMDKLMLTDQDATVAKAVGDKAGHLENMEEVGGGGGGEVANTSSGGGEPSRLTQDSSSSSSGGEADVSSQSLDSVLEAYHRRLEAPLADPRQALGMIGDLQSKCAPTEETVTLLVKCFLRHDEARKSVGENELVRVRHLRELCAVLISVCRIYHVCPDASTLTPLVDEMSRLRMEDGAYIKDLADYFEVNLSRDGVW